MEVDSVADLQVTVFDESDVERETVDARLVAGSVFRSVAGSDPGSLLLELLW